MRNSFRDGDVRNVMEMLANLKINLGEGDTLRTLFDEKVTATDVNKQFDVEKDDGVRKSHISDILDEIKELKIETREQQAEQNEAEEEDNEVTASPIQLQQLYAKFFPTQESAFLCKLPVARNYLHRALQSFREAIRKSNSPAQRQLLVTEMLTKRS